MTFHFGVTCGVTVGRLEAAITDARGNCLGPAERCAGLYGPGHGECTTGAAPDIGRMDLQGC